MGIFDLFKKKRPLTEDEKWTKLWDMWYKHKVASPYQELMDYMHDIRNDSHAGYFLSLFPIHAQDVFWNHAKSTFETMLSILPEPLHGPVKEAGNVFITATEAGEMEINDSIFDVCDELFNEHEQLLVDIVQNYANDLL